MFAALGTAVIGFAVLELYLWWALTHNAFSDSE